MRFRLLGLAVLATAVTMLSSCALLVQYGILKPDVAIKSVTYAATQNTGNGSQVTSITITFTNLGVVDENATDYRIVITTDTSVDIPGDYVVYDSTIDLPAGQDVVKQLQATDLTNYAQTHNTGAPATGDYYVAVKVDVSDTLKESDETNNTGISSTTFHVSNTGP